MIITCNFIPIHRYKLSLLKPSVKALNQSSKISVRMDKRGFLSLQYMIITDNQQVCFVEYLVSDMSCDYLIQPHNLAVSLIIVCDIYMCICTMYMSIYMYVCMYYLSHANTFGLSTVCTR